MMGSNQQRPLSVTFIAALLPVLLTTCSPQREQATGEKPSDIPVGVYAALTGPTAAFGVTTAEGVQLAADEINAAGGVRGRKIRLIIEDDQGKADEAASVVTKLITRDSVVAVIGENASTRSLAAAPICQANKVPMVSPSSTNPDVTKKGDYIFRVCFIDPFQGRAIAKFVRENLGKTKAAILRDVKNDYSVGLSNVVSAEFKEMGGTIVADQSYSEGDSDFRSQLLAIRQKKPEVIVVPGYYGDAAQIAIQAKDLGMQVLLVGGDGWDSPDLLAIGGQSIEGAYFANHYFAGEDRPEVKRFVDTYRKKFSKEPGGAGLLGYDAMKIIAYAAERGGWDRTAIRDQLAVVKDFRGVTGNITMGLDRNPIKSVVMIKVENGKFAFAGYVKP